MLNTTNKPPKDWTELLKQTETRLKQLEEEKNFSEENYKNAVKDYEELSKNFTELNNEVKTYKDTLDCVCQLLQCPMERITRALEFKLQQIDQNRELQRKLYDADQALNFFEEYYQLHSFDEVISSYKDLHFRTYHKYEHPNVTQRRQKVQFSESLSDKSYHDTWPFDDSKLLGPPSKSQTPEPPFGSHKNSTLANDTPFNFPRMNSAFNSLLLTDHQNETTQNTATSIATQTTSANNTASAQSVLNPTINTVQVTQPRYKRAPIPVFAGKEDDVIDDWIFQMELNFKADKVPQDEQVVMAASYLRDVPLQMFRNMIKYGNITWDYLKHELRKQFQPFDLQMRIRDELNELKQNGTDFTGYLRAFQMLINRSDDLSERDKIAYFRRGLPRAAANEVQYRQPDTLQEAINIAAAYEQRFTTTNLVNHKQYNNNSNRHHKHKNHYRGHSKHNNKYYYNQTNNTNNNPSNNNTNYSNNPELTSYKIL